MAASSKKVIYAALIGNSLIAVTKFVASAVTGSSAMLSEGIHSLVDTGNQILLLLGLKRSTKPPDAQYPFGHGKEIYFWSFVVAIMIFAVGAGISIYEGIHSLLDPQSIESPGVNYIVLGLAMIFEGFAWYFAWKAFDQQRGQRGYFEAVRKEKDPTTFVVLFEDSAAMAGLVIAFVGILLGQLTGNYMYDGIASVLIGVILGLTAAWLAYETKGLLIGESANKEIKNGIEELAESYDQINTVIEALTLHMGPEFILVTLNVDFKDHLKAGTVEQTIEVLAKQIKQKYPRVKRVFVEAEELRSSDE
ncbi:MAG: cation diffusion facilitator family transporter [Balneolaceae bacterium]|nr:cation diffusion facilitator family transporter [Balneolaceae bacterium]